MHKILLEKKDFSTKMQLTDFLSLMIVPTASSYSDILMNVLDSSSSSHWFVLHTGCSCLLPILLCNSVVETILGLTIKNRS